MAAARKLLIYSEDHLALIHAEINALLGGGLSAAYVKLFAKRMPNVLMAVANTIAVGYRSGVRRELKGASPEVAKAFAEIVTECGIDKRAAGLNARSWVAGPHILAPHLTKRNKLALDIIEPSACDVVHDGDDIDCVLWQLRPVPEIGAPPHPMPTALYPFGVKQPSGYIMLDAEAWRCFGPQGEDLDKTVYHYTGVCPAVPFVSFDGGPDFWAATAHNGLVDATLTIAYKVALGLFARQVSGIPLTVIFSQLEKMPPGQTLGHPILPLLLDITDKVQVFDERVVPSADYLAEISALLTMAVSAEGLPPGSVTMQANNTDWGGLAINAEGPRLSAIRDAQARPLKSTELALWPNVCDLLRGSTHRHARILPPGDEVKEMQRITFPDLSSAKEQLERIAVLKAGLPYGIASPTDLIVTAQSEMTPAEAREWRTERIEEYVTDIEPLVTRNIPAAAPEAHGVQTIAQEQGREGGQASGQTRAAQAQEKKP